MESSCGKEINLLADAIRINEFHQWCKAAAKIAWKG